MSNRDPDSMTGVPMEPPGFLSRPPRADRPQDPLDPATMNLSLPGQAPTLGPETDGPPLTWPGPQPDPSPGVGADGVDDFEARPAGKPRSFPASGSNPDDFAPVIDTLLSTGGLAANAILERRHGRDSDRWVMTDQDRAMIGGPLASIAARHAPPGATAGGDVVDAITAGIGVTGYVLRNTLGQPPAAPPGPQPVPEWTPPPAA